jgi:putative NIF3 family GTP cyclohydrolase 1 type 2
MAYARELVRKESQKPVDQMSDEELARHLQMKEKMKLERRKQKAKQREEEEQMRQEMEALQFEQNEAHG